MGMEKAGFHLTLKQLELSYGIGETYVSRFPLVSVVASRGSRNPRKSKSGYTFSRYFFPLENKNPNVV